MAFAFIGVCSYWFNWHTCDVALFLSPLPTPIFGSAIQEEVHVTSLKGCNPVVGGGGAIVILAMGALDAHYYNMVSIIIKPNLRFFKCIFNLRGTLCTA